MSSFIKTLLRFGFQYACRSRLIARVVFGVKFLPNDSAHYYFDITTYVLTRVLSKKVTAADKVLDLGTGSAGIVSLYLWQHVGCEVLAVDVNPALIAMARRAIAHNKAAIEVIEADLLSGVDWPYDVIAFNPPY